MSDAVGGADGTVSSVPTNADAVPSRANSPVPPPADHSSSNSKAGRRTTAKTPRGGGGGSSAHRSSGGGGGTSSTADKRRGGPPKSSSSTYQPHPRPPFPEPGSTLGTAFVDQPTAPPDLGALAAASGTGRGTGTNGTGGGIREVGRYFTLGRLGRGTFCSIHKCVDLGYHHTLLMDEGRGGGGRGDADDGGGDGDGDDNNSNNSNSDSTNGGSGGNNGGRPPKNQRIVAAKVELSSFANSGVLDGEATVLRHLSRHMPPATIPAYFGYVKDLDEAAAAAAAAAAAGNGGNGGNGGGGNGGGDNHAASSAVASPMPPAGGNAGGNAGGGAGAATPGGLVNPNPGLTSAIIMEYLPGEDMHRLRDRHCNVQSAAALARAKRAALRVQRQQNQTAATTTATTAATATATGKDGKADGKDGSKSASSSSSASPPSTSTIALPSPNATRRLCPEDAVYLTADVMLPLIKAMHAVGCIHRDVKPSNCVRSGTAAADRSFKLVDFGLSKSFVVPASSLGGGDKEATAEKRTWDKPWDRPTSGSSPDARGCFRPERAQADFRGTSMYASLRVHQGRDYCRRDDVWGLLYVFCDLLSGGLPWMSYALDRNRDMCRKVKEVVHGERVSVDDGADKAEADVAEDSDAEEGELVDIGDQISLLLMGADHHTTKYRRDKYAREWRAKNPKNVAGGEGPPEEQLPTVAPPLPLASDEKKVELLRKAFHHVASLGFYDTPDYHLLDSCLRGFLDDNKKGAGKSATASAVGGGEDKIDVFAEANIVPIEWAHSASDAEALRRKREAKKKGESVDDVDDVDHKKEAALKRRLLPTFNYVGTDAFDPLEPEVVLEADLDRKAAREVALAAAEAAEKAGDMAAAKEAAAAALPPPMSAEAEDLSRLPLDFQLQLAQVEYNARNPDTIAPHIALRDWMDLAKPLLYQKWDVATYERGNHRSATDGYKREVLLRIVGRCLDAAKPFGYFTKNKDCFYYPTDDKPMAAAAGSSVGSQPRKRRKIEVAAPKARRTVGSGKPRTTTPRLELSRAFSGLRGIVELEKDRKFAPPPKISFLG